MSVTSSPSPLASLLQGDIPLLRDRVFYLLQKNDFKNLYKIYDKKVTKSVSAFLQQLEKKNRTAECDAPSPKLYFCAKILKAYQIKIKDCFREFYLRQELKEDVWEANMQKQLQGALDMQIRPFIQKIHFLSLKVFLCHRPRKREKHGNISTFSIKGITLLHAASFHGDAAWVAQLIDAGAKIDMSTANLLAPLDYALMENHNEVARLLLCRDVKIRDYHFDSPLHVAATQGNWKRVVFLLQEGIDINCKNFFGDTPLHCALISGSMELITLLIEKGADVNIGNFNFVTPLHFAVKRGDEKLVQLLLSKRASIHAASYIGDTPLHVAAESGFVSIAQCLLEAGADLDVRNYMGYTPLHQAIFKNHTAMMALLFSKKRKAVCPVLGKRKQEEEMFDALRKVKKENERPCK